MSETVAKERKRNPAKYPHRRKAPPVSSDHIDAALALGHIYLGYGQPEKARIVLEALRAECPNRPMISASLGFTCLLLGQHREALRWIDEFIRGVEMDARHAPALLIRARALWGLDRVHEAEQSLERFIDIRNVV